MCCPKKKNHSKFLDSCQTQVTGDQPPELEERNKNQILPPLKRGKRKENNKLKKKHLKLTFFSRASPPKEQESPKAKRVKSDEKMDED
jgi:hypothetical protein